MAYRDYNEQAKPQSVAINTSIVGKYDDLAEQEKKIVDGAIALINATGSLAKFDQEQKRSFILTCIAMGLNPILKEVYAVPYKDSETGGYNLGTIPDYKVFLSRAERSGKLDGWEIAITGNIVHKRVEKEYKGSKYTVVKVDLDKSDLAGSITIWRKDWGRPFVSRSLKLRAEYKDTPFWNDDPEGMLEKNLIREFFPKVFPKDCDLVDYSKESRIVPEYMVMDNGYVSNATGLPSMPSASKEELLGALTEANNRLNAMALVSSKKEALKVAIASHYKDGDLDALNADIDNLKYMAQKAEEKQREARERDRPAPVDPEPAPVEIVENTAPETPPEAMPEADPAQTAIEGLIAVLDKLAGLGYSEAHICNSIRKNFPDLGMGADERDWKKAIYATDKHFAGLQGMTKYYRDALDILQKKAKKEAKKDVVPDLIEKFDRIATRAKLDLETMPEVVENWTKATEASLKIAISMITAPKAQQDKIAKLLKKQGKTLADFGLADVPLDELAITEADLVEREIDPF